MYGLPQSTEVKRPLPKAQLYKKFELKQSQRDTIDADIVRMDFVNLIAPQTLPAIAEGVEVKAVFVVEVELKRQDFDIKTITLIAKLIPQQIIFTLRYGEKVRFAVYLTKLFVTDWQSLTPDSSLLILKGLNLDTVWQNIVTAIADMEIVEGDSLVERIKIDAQREKALRQISVLEKEMRTTSQTRRQRELYSQIKKLKSIL